MAPLLGDKSRFAVEFGEWYGGLRQVDLWAADQWLTCDDSMAFVPQLHSAVKADCGRLESIARSPSPSPGMPPGMVHRWLLVDDGQRREEWSFLQWGPTTDNVLAHLFPDEGHLAITVQFWREGHQRLPPEHTGAVFTVEIQAEELAEILQATVAILDHDPNLAA